MRNQNEKDQRNETSLLKRLQDRAEAEPLSLHMPGHKGNVKRFPYLSALGGKLDLTEIPGFDDLHDPQEILLEDMELAASLWGSRKSFLMVNGSTGGILAGVRSLTRRGDKVLLARNCHRSVYHAVELCGLQPVYLNPPMVEESSGITGPITPAMVEKALLAQPDLGLVILTSPTYEGVLSDIRGICRIAHARGVPVMVDEAHGAHLGLTGDFPEGAIQSGADLVVQSLHKLLPALTQTAILHLGHSQLVDAKRVQQNLRIFETSSPSYLLMASMDGCLRLLKDRKEALFAGWKNRIMKLNHRLEGLTSFHNLQENFRQAGILFDPSKFAIDTYCSPVTGVQLEEILREHYGIELEMAMDTHVLAMTGPGDPDEMPERFAGALLDLEKDFGRSQDQGSRQAPGPEKNSAQILPHQASKTGGNVLLPLPRQVCGIEEAEEMGQEELPFSECADQVAGEYILAYPPGIPILVPGEVVSKDHAAYLDQLRGAGVHLVRSSGSRTGMLFCLKA